MTPTPAQRRLLERVAQAEADGISLHVYRNPGTVGAGVHPATIDDLFRASLVTLGPYVPLRGRPLTLTDAGRAALAPTPADELRAAAARLRETAAKAAPAPWDTDGPWWWDTEPLDATTTITTQPERQTVAVIPPAYNRHPQAEASAAWIALMHPALAEPLAAWLEQAARTANEHPQAAEYAGLPDLRWCDGCADEECEGLQNLDKALAVAHVINRSHHA